MYKINVFDRALNFMEQKSNVEDKEDEILLNIHFHQQVFALFTKCVSCLYQVFVMALVLNIRKYEIKQKYHVYFRWFILYCV